jgi:hypothetical protein
VRAKFLQSIHPADLCSVPLSVSWSALQNHEECRQKHKLSQTGKKNPSTDIRGFFHGIVADRVMRKWLGDDDRLPNQMPGMVEEMIEASLAEAIESGDGVVRWKGPDDRAWVQGYCIELVTKLEPILNTLVLPYDYQPELRFRTPIMLPYLEGTPQPVILIGGIDIVVREDEATNTWSAYDLKATANDSYINKVLGQGVFYDLAMRAMYGSSPRQFGFIQPMCKEQVVYTVITEDDRRELLSRLERMVQFMWRRDWEPKKENKGCSYCPFKHACEKFSPAQQAGAIFGIKPRVGT